MWCITPHDLCHIMFSGIIKAKGKILSAENRDTIRLVLISAPPGWKFEIGDSVSVDGICSTVIVNSSGSFAVEFMPETLQKTTANEFEKGRAVNLERSLRLGDEMHGHIVQGHVDALGIVEDIEHDELVICAPQQAMRLIVQKGSVAINGVALTVAEKKIDMFKVALIPFTLLETNLGSLEKGMRVNIETDILARYLDSLHTKV